MAEEKTIDPKTVYISFTGKDKETVETFVGMLKANNIPYRVSIEEDIDFISKFEEEIGNGQIVVIFYSPDYFKSYHCMNEYSLTRTIENGKRVFTYKCRDCNFEEIKKDLKRHWTVQKADYEDEIFEELTAAQQAAYKNEFYIEKDIHKDKYEISIYRLTNYFRDKQYKNGLETLLECVQNEYQGHPTPQDSYVVAAAPAPSLPKMTIREGIVPREKEVDDLKKLLDENRLVNMIGLGGCGKSTISEYFYKKYSQDYHIVTSVVVSIDYYKDFVEKFREAMGVPYKFDDDFKKDVAKTPNYKKTYDAIIEQLESDKYKGSDGKPNLIVIDVNETADYEPVRKELADFRSRLSSWKIFVVSRVKMCPDVTWYEPLNVTDVDDNVLKDIFFQYLDKRRHDYYRNELNNHFSQLFTFLFRLPLLIEQLAYYLSNDIFNKTYQEILRDLKIDQDVFNQRFAGRNAKITDKDKYKVIEDYLGTLIIFSKLDDLTQTGTLLRDIARHFAVLPTGFYEADFIKKFVVVSDEFRIGEGLRFLVDKCILAVKDDEMAFQMHGLVAESCRKQIYTLEENKEFRNFDGFKQRVDSFDKTYDSYVQQDSDSIYRASIADSFTNFIPNTEEEDNYVLRKAHQYQNKDIYEHILKVKLLRLKKVDGSLFVHLSSDDFVKYSVEFLYFSWLQQQPDKVLVPMRTDEDGNIILTIKGIVLKMIKVDGGTFLMGAQKSDKNGDNYDEEAEDNEKPVHNVELSDFYIGETPVTRGLWNAVMGGGKIRASEFAVGDVSWYDCLNFIIELNRKTGLKFRFPTEAQWEFAARGGTKKTGNYKYSGSNNIYEVAWFGIDRERGESESIKQKRPNELQIYDMSGNVFEWCKDLYGPYQDELQIDPQGGVGMERVLRGGAWCSVAFGCRVSSRYSASDEDKSDINVFGLRLALLSHS